MRLATVEAVVPPDVDHRALRVPLWSVAGYSQCPMHWKDELGVIFEAWPVAFRDGWKSGEACVRSPYRNVPAWFVYGLAKRAYDGVTPAQVAVYTGEFALRQQAVEAVFTLTAAEMEAQLAFFLLEKDGRR